MQKLRKAKDNKLSMTGQSSIPAGEPNTLWFCFWSNFYLLFQNYSTWTLRVANFWPIFISIFFQFYCKESQVGG